MVGDWAALGRDRFDRLIEALIVRRHPQGSRVDVVDGRGGDGGVDVLAVDPHAGDSKEVVFRDDPGHLTVYQLKFFPEGFDGMYQKRRSQIKKSFNRARDKFPDMKTWSLVCPCKATNSGHSFLDSIRKEFPEVEIQFVDQARLDGDGWCASYPDVVRNLVSRDDLLVKAKILSQERAVLAGGVPDLIERQMNLDSIADELDPHWTTRVTTDAQGNPATFVLPKHPQAATASPISLKLKVDRATPQGEEFLHGSAFGAFEPTALEAKSISSLQIDGPAFISEAINTSNVDSIVLNPTTKSPPLPITFTATDTNKNVVGQYMGMAHAATGPVGARLRLSFAGGAALIENFVPHGERHQVRTTVTRHFAQGGFNRSLQHRSS